MDTTENQPMNNNYTTATYSLFKPKPGYIAFNDDMSGIFTFLRESGKTYEVGKTYTMDDNKVKKLGVFIGFHFCKIPIDLLNYYDKNNKFAIIKPNGEIKNNLGKYLCSQITIIKLITFDELYTITNGKYDAGNGYTVYYQNGRLHCNDDQPAVESCSDKQWFRNGILHRDDDKPAIESYKSIKIMLEDGKYHWRNDDPYDVKHRKVEVWFKDGTLHRANGPAIVYQDGHKEWYNNGQLHRIGGPAIEYSYGCKVWYKNGVLHREDGPAIDNPFGYGGEWYINGKHHREDGPAVDYRGRKEWYINGQLHRNDGPAVIITKESQYDGDARNEWYKNGKLHRLDGPAIEYADGDKHWYINGEYQRHDEGGATK